MSDLVKVEDIFGKFELQLSEVRKINREIVFDYESKEGNKEARSHIYKLRQSKSAISDAHKNAKAEALEFGRKLDAEKKRLIGEIEDMINVHLVPIQEIEKREQDRIDAINSKIEYIEAFKNCTGSVAFLTKTREELMSFSIDDSFDEFKENAESVRGISVFELSKKIDEQQKIEDAEKEEEARIQEERRKREIEIAEQAKAKAEQEAKEIIERQRIELENEKLKAEMAKIQGIEEQKKAEQEKELQIAKAIEDEKRRQEQEKEKERIEKEKRESDLNHKSNIMREAKESFIEAGFSEERAKQIVWLIKNGSIKNVTINF